ncbi:GNAT family N-acetyltransferase [Undibacterium sp. TJN25]|uniref:GNAT family N-acetyltransferase n=1 Tax=Undibacterium sp. TJN25 TaxID=3413056 RepID=UPI003BF11B5B
MEHVVQIQKLEAISDADREALIDVLTDCVAGGASVSFMHPLSPAKAGAFWQDVADGVAAGKRLLLVARDSTGSIAGTVQLVLGQPENQPHRADVSKLLVHRRARKQGMGEALMKELEQHALAAGKTTLVLDTATGSGAERLYERLGWVFCGRIPDYALWPDGGLCATSLYVRALGAQSA